MIEKLYIIFKTHLDIGYTDFSADVVNNYMKSFIPQAIEVSRKLREKGSSSRFVWTTGSWLIYEYLRRANKKEKQNIERAINDGDVRWHALPFTTHTELMTGSLFEYGLSLSKRLDERFGKKTIAAKMTDVPGHTKAMIPYLSKSGIELLHIGVNPTSAVPEVPTLFRWQADSGEKITVMYNAEYGEFTEIGDTGAAVYFAHTGDNHGPQSAEQIESLFQSLHEKYPEAELVAATLDDIVPVIKSIEASLPIITDEIGDSWIHGAGTDPQKISCLRSMQRLCEALDSKSDIEILNDAMLMVCEHTCGFSGMSSLGDSEHYTRQTFEDVRKTEKFKRIEASWEEQREYIYSAVKKLSPEASKKAMSLLEDSSRELTDIIGCKKIAFNEKIHLGDFEISFNQKGEINHLMFGEKCYADGEHRLGSYFYEQFSDNEYQRFFGQYNRWDIDWARWDFTKPGMEKAVDKYYCFYPDAEIYAGKNLLILRFSFDEKANREFGCPLVSELRIKADGHKLIFDYAWFEKPANRMTEALWVGFNPKATNKRIRKLNSWIDPKKIVNKGGIKLHATDYGVQFDELSIQTLDTALVSPSYPSLLNFNSERPSDSDPIYFNLYNNVWGTNFPLWYDDDARFRFILTVI